RQLVRPRSTGGGWVRDTAELPRHRRAQVRHDLALPVSGATPGGVFKSSEGGELLLVGGASRRSVQREDAKRIRAPVRGCEGREGDRRGEPAVSEQRKLRGAYPGGASRREAGRVAEEPGRSGLLPLLD